MERFIDHDGKSQTGLAVDIDHSHNPDMESDEEWSYQATHPPAYSEISERAYEIWIQRGCPSNSADSDWFEAERQLTSGRDSISLARALRNAVQS